MPTYESAETRKGYTKQLSKVEAVLGGMTWDAVTLPILREYLERRKANTQGNRELSVLSIVWSHARMWGMTQLHWPAAGVKSWKAPEKARDFTVTDELFQAVYQEADTVCFLIPGTDRQGETVQSGLTSNSLESGGIKTWVVQPLPNAQELYGVFISQP